MRRRILFVALLLVVTTWAGCTSSSRTVNNGGDVSAPLYRYDETHDLGVFIYHGRIFVIPGSQMKNAELPPSWKVFDEGTDVIDW